MFSGISENEFTKKVRIQGWSGEFLNKELVHWLHSFHTFKSRIFIGSLATATKDDATRGIIVYTSNRLVGEVLVANRANGGRLTKFLAAMVARYIFNRRGLVRRRRIDIRTYC